MKFSKQFILYLVALIWSTNIWAQKAPAVFKKSFNKESLSQFVYKPNGDSLTMKNVLNQYKGQVLVLDLWAGWCKDCIAVMNDNKTLKADYPTVKFLYLSLDRSDTAWYKSIEKYGLQEEANFWFKEGWKNKFTNNIDLNWIPRYLVVDKRGGIKGYYFVHPQDKAFRSLLDKLTKA